MFIFRFLGGFMESFYFYRKKTKKITGIDISFNFLVHFSARRFSLEGSYCRLWLDNFRHALFLYSGQPASSWAAAL